MVNYVLPRRLPSCLAMLWMRFQCHIVSSKAFQRISSSPHLTLPNVNYDAPEEVCGERKLFDRPLKK